MPIVIRRPELEQTLIGLNEIKLRDNLLPLVLEARTDALNILNSAFSRAIQLAISSGKKPEELTEIDIDISEHELQDLLGLQAIFHTMYPEFYSSFSRLLDAISPQIDALRNQAIIDKAAADKISEDERKKQEEAEKKAYPPAQNDFERVLQSQGVPAEVLKETNTAEKYKAYRKYFFSIGWNAIWLGVKNAEVALETPLILSASISVPGIQQSKSITDIISTLNQVREEERPEANALQTKLTYDFVAVDTLNNMVIRLVKEKRAESHDGVKEAYLGVSNPTFFNNWIWKQIGSMDFPILEPNEKGLLETNNDNEPVKEKLFRALQEMISRRLFPDDRRKPESWKELYQAVYLRRRPNITVGEDGNLPDPDIAGLTANQQQEEIRSRTIHLPRTIFPLYHYDKYGRRNVPRQLKIKRLPGGPEGAYFPRVYAVKDLPGEREMVRRQFLGLLQDPNNPQQDDFSVAPGDSYLEYNQKTFEKPFRKRRSANAALLWSELLAEVAGEGAFQDARREDSEEKNKYYRGNPQAVTRYQQLYNPTLSALRYLDARTETDSKTGRINSFLIGWQSFLLTFFDYWIITDKNGKSGTLAQHIMKANSYDDVPWEKINDSFTGGWLDHMRQMLDIGGACFDGFKSGNLRNLAEFDQRTLEISKMNEKFIGELMGLYRQVSTYMLGTYCRPAAVIPEFAKNESEANRAALETGQFVRILVQDARGKAQDIEYVTRAGQFIMFDEVDMLNWVPKENKKRLGSENWARWAKSPDGALNLVIRLDSTRDPDTGKDALPHPRQLLEREVLTRIIATASSEGDTIKNLRKEDIVVLGLVFSSQVRELYKNKYFKSVGAHAFSKMMSGLARKISPDLFNIDPEFFEYELPPGGGADLFTKDLFMIMLEKIGHKVTFEELLETGRSLVTLVSGGEKKK